MGQLAGPAKQNPAFQLAAVPAFHDIAGAGRKGREKRGENREAERGRERNYLLNK